jgi:hypothetical protein
VCPISFVQDVLVCGICSPSRLSAFHVASLEVPLDLVDFFVLIEKLKYLLTAL